jgi:hypothetical protein
MLLQLLLAVVQSCRCAFVAATKAAVRGICLVTATAQTSFNYSLGSYDVLLLLTG